MRVGVLDGRGPKRRPIEERLRSRLVPAATGCIEYVGGNVKGYGRLYDADRDALVLAHRVAWEIANGPIPEGFWVLHHCDNPPCCNPDHLFLGDNQDNVDDKMAKGRHTNGRWERTHCLKGHEYTPENTKVNKNGHRNCRTCKSAKNRRSWKKFTQKETT